jgi:phosphoglycolate phosphatase
LRENVERILGPDNVARMAHFSCGASMFGKASKLRGVIKSSGIPPTRTVYVGDEVRDAEAARKAGAAFGAVAWGQHSEQALRAENPTEFFSRPEDIVTAVLGNV